MRYLILTLILVACKGSTGPAGSPGSAGEQGPTGQAGQNGAPVEICPGVHGMPPEIGLCINNVLYGIYSMRWGGFTEFPNGTYHMKCTFTVDGCTVTR